METLLMQVDWWLILLLGVFGLILFVIRIFVKRNCRSNLLLAAISENDVSAVEELLHHGVDVESKKERGWTPLMYAVEHSSTPEIVTLLLEKGAEVNARDNEGWTPLMYAAKHSSTPEIVTLLLEKGAEVNAWNNDLKPFMYLDEAGRQTCRGRFPGWSPGWSEENSPLAKGGVLALTSARGFTPLMIAAAASTAPEIVTLLLEKGASALARDYDGYQAIDYAKGNENLKGTAVYQQLLELSKE
jgi:ankyrin repeat protein